MKLHELLDVMVAQVRVEIIVCVDDCGGTITVFDGKAGRVLSSILRKYGACDVREINGSLVDESDVKFDKKGGLYFKNSIQIFICKEENQT